MLLRNVKVLLCRPANIKRTECDSYFGKGRAIFIARDVTKADDFEKIFKKIIDTFKELDILINI